MSPVLVKDLHYLLWSFVGLNVLAAVAVVIMLIKGFK